MPTTERRPGLAATRALRRAIAAVPMAQSLERAVDARTGLGRRVAGLRAELEDHLGGPSAVSPTQRLVIEALVRQTLLADVVDAQILSTPIDATNPDHRKLLELGTKGRHAIATLCGMLGLDRVAPPVKDARSILLEYAKESAQENAQAPGEPAREGAPHRDPSDGGAPCS